MKNRLDYYCEAFSVKDRNKQTTVNSKKKDKSPIKEKYREISPQDNKMTNSNKMRLVLHKNL
jgi:hypothetical protein